MAIFYVLRYEFLYHKVLRIKVWHKFCNQTTEAHFTTFCSSFGLKYATRRSEQTIKHCSWAGYKSTLILSILNRFRDHIFYLMWVPVLYKVGLFPIKCYNNFKVGSIVTAFCMCEQKVHSEWIKFGKNEGHNHENVNMQQITQNKILTPAPNKLEQKPLKSDFRFWRWQVFRWSSSGTLRCVVW